MWKLKINWSWIVQIGNCIEQEIMGGLGYKQREPTAHAMLGSGYGEGFTICL